MRRTATLLAALALWLGACDTSDPRPEAFGGDTTAVHSETDFFEKFETLIVSPEGTGITAAALEARAVTLVDGAEGEIVAAFARLQSTAIADALVAAKERGVTVLIAADTDARNDAGFATLREGGVSVVFGNGPITWSPQPGLNVRRLGSQNRMTHTMIIADGLRLLAVTGGFFDPTDEDAVASRWQVGFVAVGQIFCKDFRHTLKQLVAGTFATTLTLFGASTSADGNNRTVYPIEDGVVEAYYGPQEPLAKHMIDEIYKARASVWIASQTFANEALVDALRYKVRAGFDVRVLVPRGATDEQYCFPGARSDCCERPNNPASVCGDDDDCREGESCDGGRCSEIRCQNYFERVGLVADLEAALEADGAEGIIREKAAPMGTVVVLDAIRSPINGTKYAGQAMISSQPLSSTIAFGPTELRDGSLPGRPSDVFTDGHMVVLREINARPGTGDFGAAAAWFEALWEVE